MERNCAIACFAELRFCKGGPVCSGSCGARDKASILNGQNHFSIGHLAVRKAAMAIRAGIICAKGSWRSHDAHHGERGVTMIFVAVAMVAIIGMAVLSIDVVILYLAKEEAQHSADLAALAAARVLSLSGVTGDPDNIQGSLPSAPWQAACALWRNRTQSAV